MNLYRCTLLFLSGFLTSSIWTRLTHPEDYNDIFFPIVLLILILIMGGFNILGTRCKSDKKE